MLTYEDRVSWLNIIWDALDEWQDMMWDVTEKDRIHWINVRTTMDWIAEELGVEVGVDSGDEQA